MKGAYSKFYKMGRNETFAVFAITFAVVMAYSVWGAYLLHNQASSPQVVTIRR
jgi:hypothetical protein